MSLGASDSVLSHPMAASYGSKWRHPAGDFWPEALFFSQSLFWKHMTPRPGKGRKLRLGQEEE